MGNAGGTAYAPVTMSGDCTRSSTGAITCTKSNGTAFGPLATESIVMTAQGGLGANNSSASGIPRFASGVATVTAEVGISGGSPVKATNTYGCLDGYDHLGCVVWRATRLTAQTASAGTANFVPGLAGWYRMSVMGCITTVGTAGTLNTTIWTGPIQGPVISFTSGLGNCTVVRQDEYAPASGTT